MLGGPGKGRGALGPNRGRRRRAHDCGLSLRPARFPAQLPPVASRGCGVPGGERLRAARSLRLASCARRAPRRPRPEKAKPKRDSRSPPAARVQAGPRSPSRGAGSRAARLGRGRPRVPGLPAAPAEPLRLSLIPSPPVADRPAPERCAEWAGAASTRWGRCPCCCW